RSPLVSSRSSQRRSGPGRASRMAPTMRRSRGSESAWSRGASRTGHLPLGLGEALPPRTVSVEAQARLQERPAQSVLLGHVLQVPAQLVGGQFGQLVGQVAHGSLQGERPYYYRQFGDRKCDRSVCHRTNRSVLPGLIVDSLVGALPSIELAPKIIW